MHMGRSGAVCRQVLRSEELDGVQTSRVASHHHRSLACVFSSALICLLFVVFSKCLGPDFVPYLPLLMPPLLAAASANVSLALCCFLAVVPRSLVTYLSSDAGGLAVTVYAHRLCLCASSSSCGVDSPPSNKKYRNIQLG